MSRRVISDDNNDYKDFGKSNNLLAAEDYFANGNQDLGYLNRGVYNNLFNKIKDIMNNINESNQNISNFSRDAKKIIQEINELINEIFGYIEMLKKMIDSSNVPQDEKDKIIQEMEKANMILVQLFNETNPVNTNDLQVILRELENIKNRLQEKVQELNVYTKNRQTGGRRYKGTKKRSSRRTKKSVVGKKRRSTRRHRKR